MGNRIDSRTITSPWGWKPSCGGGALGGRGAGSGPGLAVIVASGGAGRRRALGVDREILDRRVRAAEREIRISPEFDLAEAHAESVVGQEPPDERLADTGEALGGLRRPHHPHPSWERAPGSSLASAGHHAWRRRGRIEAAVALAG